MTFLNRRKLLLFFRFYKNQTRHECLEESKVCYLPWSALRIGEVSKSSEFLGHQSFIRTKEWHLEFCFMNLPMFWTFQFFPKPCSYFLPMHTFAAFESQSFEEISTIHILELSFVIFHRRKCYARHSSLHFNYKGRIGLIIRQMKHFYSNVI